jgi:tetratricopeptide (TPR) repeat protein
MTAMLRDAYGLSVTTASREALDAYDRGVRGLLGFRADTIDSFRQALAEDPEFALARAALAVALFLDEELDEAKTAMAAAAARAPALPPRERRHLEALGAWMSGRSADALRLIGESLAETPRDVVLLQRAYFIHFWQGRAAEMLQLSTTVLGALEPDPHAWAMHAFSLEENRRFDEALAFAERALAADPRDAWAIHTLAHVLYERGDNARGIEALPTRIEPCDHLGYFRNHLLWHLALMHLADGRYEEVRRMFERVFGGVPVTVASDLQDSVSLAWRLDLFGHPDPTRWARLGTAARAWLERPLLLFHDVHVAMALAASGDEPAASQHLEAMRARSRKTRNRTLPEVVVPLVEGLHAFAAGDHARAAERLEPIQDRIVEVGGSHAQREVFHDTLFAAALRADLGERATALLQKNLGARPPRRYGRPETGLGRAAARA